MTDHASVAPDGFVCPFCREVTPADSLATSVHEVGCPMLLALDAMRMLALITSALTSIAGSLNRIEGHLRKGTV